MRKIIVAFPVRPRPDGALLESAAAIGADIVEDALHAIRTEGAFERADHRFRRMRRQRLAAILANRPEFEHGSASSAAAIEFHDHNRHIREVHSLA
jgi:hypothetical protein